MYEYKAIVRSIYDADTIRVDIDLGLHTWIHNVPIRLYGIDAPEVRGPERERGLAARDFLRELMPPSTTIVLYTHKDKRGKYGRWLGKIMLPDGLNINDHLVGEGHAVYKAYGGK